MGSSHWAVAAVVMVAPLLSSGTASATLGISKWTIDAGGVTQAAGGSLRLGATIGQPDAGASSGGSLLLLGGFWKGGTAVSSVPDPGPGPEGRQPPLAFGVTAGGPSPFAAETRLRLDLPEARPVRACVHDLAGRLVRVLCAQTLLGGSHELRWDGRGDAGRRLPSGIYLVRIEAGADRSTRQLVLLSR